MKRKVLSEIKEYDERFKQIKNEIECNDLVEMREKLEDYRHAAFELKDQEFIGNAYFLYGFYYSQIGELNQAVSEYIKAKEFFGQTNSIEKRLEIEKEIGNAYHDLKRYEDALKSYLGALDYIENHKEYQEIKAKITSNIGLVYFWQEKYKEAEKYYSKSAQIFKEEGLKSFLPMVLCNLASADFYQGEIEKALKIIEEAVNISKENKSELDLYCSYLLHAIYTYAKNKDFKELKTKATIALDKIEETGSAIYVIDSHKIYIKALFQLEIYKECIRVAEIFLPKIQHSEFYAQHEIILSVLERSYIILEEYENAYKALKANINVRIEANSYESESVTYKRTLQNSKVQRNKEYVGNLENSRRMLKLLAKIGEGINLNIDIRGIFEYIIEQIYEIWDIDIFGMAVVHEGKSHYYYKAIGEAIRYGIVDLENKEFVMNYCIRENKEIIIQNTKLKGDIVNVVPKELVQKIYMDQQCAIIFLPLSLGENVLGGISIQSRIHEYFSKEDMDMFRTLASYCMSAITNYERHKKLEKIKDTDGLTGVKNRHALKVFNNILDHSFLEIKMPMLMAIFDIDYFKDYNDEYGHLEGDQCLIQITSAVEKILKPYNGELYRYGGDEFTIVCQEIDDRMSRNLLASIIKCVSDLKIKHAKNIEQEYVTISMGAILTYEINASYQAYYQKADEALYEVKNQGRNDYRLEVRRG